MIVTGERGVRVRAALRRRRARARDPAADARRGAGQRRGRGRGARRGRGAGARTARVRAAACAGSIMAGRDGRDVRVPAPLVIAADGRRSRLAVAARPRAPAAPSAPLGDRRLLRERRRRDAPFGEMHVRRGRYLGIAPRAVAAAPMSAWWCLPRRAGRTRRAEPALLRRRSTAIRTLRERFADARMTTAPVVLGPLAVDAAAPGAPGLLLAGDAAGFIDPMTGDGLRFARARRGARRGGRARRARRRARGAARAPGAPAPPRVRREVALQPHAAPPRRPRA